MNRAPVQVIAPKFVEMSEKNPDAVFLKVVGDSSPDASKLMKREGVRSVPGTFCSRLRARGGPAPMSSPL